MLFEEEREPLRTAKLCNCAYYIHMFPSAANASESPLSLCMLSPKSPAWHFGPKAEFFLTTEKLAKYTASK